MARPHPRNRVRQDNRKPAQYHGLPLKLETEQATPVKRGSKSDDNPDDRDLYRTGHPRMSQLMGYDGGHREELQRKDVQAETPKRVSRKQCHEHDPDSAHAEIGNKQPQVCPPNMCSLTVRTEQTGPSKSPLYRLKRFAIGCFNATASTLVTHIGTGHIRVHLRPSAVVKLPHLFANAFAAACWKFRRTSLASLFGKFERCTIRT